MATQFKADPKTRIVGHKEEPPRDPFSPEFRSLIEKGTLKRVRPAAPRPSSGSTPSAFPHVTEGDKIEHERFGIGTVIKLEGTGENQKATVEFSNSGTKQLLLKFARFKVIK